jgi:hypothetical protein
MHIRRCTQALPISRHSSHHENAAALADALDQVVENG